MERVPDPQQFRSRGGGEVLAIQWQPDDPEAAGAAAGWLMGFGYMPEVREDFVTEAKLLGWRDRYGPHEVWPGDWIVKVGAEADLFAISADIFGAEFTAMADA